MDMELTDQELQNITGGSNVPPAFGFGFATNNTNAGSGVSASNTSLGFGSGSLMGFGTANGVANSLHFTGPFHISLSNGFSQSSGTGFGINYPN
ncbi:MAG: bacteriocin [Chloroflexota bacterium]|nr:bacteriocin [Chloroflexota bacterium]